MNKQAATVAAAAELPPAAGRKGRRQPTGSLTRRMIGVAAVWIAACSLIGGFALDRVLSRSIVDSFDNQLIFILNSMIASSEIDPIGDVRLNRPLADQRFVEPYSGLYYQVSGSGAEPRVALTVGPPAARRCRPHRPEAAPLRQRRILHPRECGADPRCRTRRRASRLAGRAGGSRSRNRARRSTSRSAASLDPDLELRRARRRPAGAGGAADLLRPVAVEARAPRSDRNPSGRETRISDEFPTEIRPLTEEINLLFAHSEEQAEEARRHAGNLAHALKTPLTVINNAATANAPDLADTVCREAVVMRRQVDHHLARARAIGRRASPHARTRVWESLEAVQRAVDRLYEGVTIDIAGDHGAQVGSSARTSTRCSATSSRMPRNMAAAGCS